jgi:glycosyltransferase involved in cell wall biosynthesis
VSGDNAGVRIALIAPPWLPVPPPGYGGTEAVVDRLARGFAAVGHQVLLFTTGDSTCPVPRASVYPRAAGRHLGVGPRELRHVLHAYQAVQGHDIVHDHTVVGPVYAERFPGLQVVTTNHGPFNPERTDIYRAIAGRVPIIAVSRAQAAAAGDIPIATVIHHGVDLDRFPVGTGSGGYLAHVGRMSPDKGVREAIQIARAAGVPLRIAAKMRDEPERDYYRTTIEPLLGRDIDYLGELDQRERNALLAEARALLNPICWPEPFGLVMIEALSCGTPVLATARGAAPEIVDDGVTGFIRPRPAQLIDTVPQLDRIDRAACRTAVEQRFTTRHMVQAHLDLFQTLVRHE